MVLYMLFTTGGLSELVCNGYKVVMVVGDIPLGLIYFMVKDIRRLVIIGGYYNGGFGNLFMVWFNYLVVIW